MANHKRHPSTAYALGCNLLLLIAAYMLCRLAFVLENHTLFHGIGAAEAWGIIRGGLRFDLSAIAYSNALYVLLLFFPLHIKERRDWQTFLHILFVAVNTICLASNLADAVYYPFIKRRTTASVFTEFQNDNLTNIIGLELANHWYLTLLGVLLAVALWLLYRTPSPSTAPRWKYYLTQVIGLLCSAPLLIVGIRGGVDPELRPLHNGNARELTSSFDDDATGIQNILTVDRDGTERWYDLNGRRIDQPTKKGIYIRNGKKEIRK